MEQTQIYDYLGIEQDPIFFEILKLKKGQHVELGGVIVSLNSQGLYEIETESYHNCFSSKKDVYDGVSRIFSLMNPVHF